MASALATAVAAERRHSMLEDSAMSAGFVGGAFACAVKSNDVWCAGDDGFGQLGLGPAPHTRPSLLGMVALNDLSLG